MKFRALVSITVMALLGSASAIGQIIVDVPVKNKRGDLKPATRPKAPLNLFVTVYCFPSENRLSYSFSDTIETMDVTVINQTTGEVYFSLITHADPDMILPLTAECNYQISCITETGVEFETELLL